MKYNDFNFKNAGVAKKDLNNITNLSEKDIESFPIGINLPLGFGSKKKETLLKMNFDVESEIKENLKLLLLCSKNELMRKPNFGTNLYSLFNSTNTSEEEKRKLAEKEVKDAVDLFMNPCMINDSEYYVNIIDSSIEKESYGENNNIIDYYVKITYNISGYSMEDLVLYSKIYDSNINDLYTKNNQIIIRFNTSA